MIVAPVGAPGRADTLWYQYLSRITSKTGADCCWVTIASCKPAVPDRSVKLVCAFNTPPENPHELPVCTVCRGRGNLTHGRVGVDNGHREKDRHLRLCRTVGVSSGYNCVMCVMRVVVLAFLAIVSTAALGQTAGTATQAQSPVTEISADLGPCSVEFHVTDFAGAPLYNAEMKTTSVTAS